MVQFCSLTLAIDWGGGGVGGGGGGVGGGGGGGGEDDDDNSHVHTFHSCHELWP